VIRNGPTIEDTYYRYTRRVHAIFSSERRCSMTEDCLVGAGTVALEDYLCAESVLVSTKQPR